MEISSLQLKRWFGEGCQLCVAHVEEPTKCRSPSLEEFTVLQQDFVDVFEEIPGLLPKGDIDFSIDLVQVVSPVCKTQYRMSIEELKELQM